MLLTKTVKLKWNPSNREHYTSKGYTYTHWHDEFEVRIEDLVPGNHNKLDFVCDYCDEKFTLVFRQYNGFYKNNPSGKHSCEKCNNIRLSENKLIEITNGLTEDNSKVKRKIYRVNIEDDYVFIKKCRTCKRFKEINCFRENKQKDYIEYHYECTDCEKEFRELHRSDIRLRHVKGTSNKMYLQADMTVKQFERMLERFDNRCAITKSTNVVCEHFIPVSWGHGGTYEGNLYLLNEVLNISKGSKNPFEWVKDKKVKSKLNMGAWRKLIKYLAAKNKLTEEEFKRFVYWCEMNKRSAIEIEKDKGKTSIELWKQSVLEENK